MLLWPFIQEKPLISPHIVIEIGPLTLPNIPIKIETQIETYVPRHQVALPDFAAIQDIETKKRRFFSFLRPYIDAENKRLIRLHNWLIFKRNQLQRHEALTPTEKQKLRQLLTRYRITMTDESSQRAIEALLKRIDGLPMALVLMQAANESAWGSSRFARLGLNFFGQWCYSKGCGVVPKGRDVGKTYEVAAFLTVAESVKSYFKNINTNPAYALLRDIRYQLRENNQALDAEVLATGLLSYSERGEQYVEEISRMIRYNQKYISSQ